MRTYRNGKDRVMSVLNLTADNFNEVIGEGKVLVDFWAGWCMPCKMVAPIIDELADEFKDSITVAKVDVENEKALAVRFKVMSIPTVVLFEDGNETKRFVGVKTKEEYIKELEAES